MRILFCFLMAGALVMGGCSPEDRAKFDAELSDARAFGSNCAIAGNGYKACRDICWDRFDNWQTVKACREGAIDIAVCPSCGPSK